MKFCVLDGHLLVFKLTLSKREKTHTFNQYFQLAQVLKSTMQGEEKH